MRVGHDEKVELLKPFDRIGNAGHGVAAVAEHHHRSDDVALIDLILGQEHPVDVIVWATGFRAHDFVAPMDITGTRGHTLREAWSEVPCAYLGLSVPRFPNMFLIYGPNTNGGTGSVVVTIESNMRHVLAALKDLDKRAADRIEVDQATADRFDDQLRAALRRTVWHTGCENWYLDAQGNNPNQWPWLLSTYRRRTARLEAGAYSFATIPATIGEVA